MSLEALSYYLRDKIMGGPSTDFCPRPLADVITEHVNQTLEYYEGDRDETAKALGISLARLSELLP